MTAGSSRHLVEDEDSSLSTYLLALPELRQRATAASVARLALEVNGLEDPTMGALLDTLVAGDQTGVRAVPLIARRVQELDEAYFELAREVDGPDDDGDPDDPRWAQVWALFRRARAMESLQYACALDSTEAVQGAVYSCIAALDGDLAAVRAAAGFVPGSQSPPRATELEARASSRAMPARLRRWLKGVGRN